MRIIGIHPVGAEVFLIEIADDGVEPDWMQLTQPLEGRTNDYWQVPYDERRLEQPGHWAFFFHYLDLARPLDTEFGPLQLPSPTPVPAHLADIIYETPC